MIYIPKLIFFHLFQSKKKYNSGRKNAINVEYFCKYYTSAYDPRGALRTALRWYGTAGTRRD